MPQIREKQSPSDLIATLQLCLRYTCLRFSLEVKVKIEVKIEVKVKVEVKVEVEVKIKVEAEAKVKVKRMGGNLGFLNSAVFFDHRT